MESIADVLFETVLAGVFDPVVLGVAALFGLALCSGVVARVIELAEAWMHARTVRERSPKGSPGPFEVAAETSSTPGELAATPAR